MKEDTVWAVGAFGSCRINEPLTTVRQHGLISYKFDSAIGYLHNPLELQQAIKLLRSEIKAPLHLYKLINITSATELKNEDRFYRLFVNIDVIICEISSVRIIEYNSWFLQLNRFRELLAEFGIEERDTSELFRSATAKSDIASRLADRPGAEIARDIILNSKFYELNLAALREEILRLRSLIPNHPVVFVGIATQDYNNEPIQQRIALRDVMKSIAETVHDTAFIDPTVYVMRDGMDFAMQDLGHYNKFYELIAGGHIYQQLNAFCRGNARVNFLSKRRMIRAATRNAANQAAEAAAVASMVVV